VLWHCWLGGRKEDIRPVKTEWWGAGVVVCLERDADLHMAQMKPLPLTVSCFSKIQIGFTFLVPAHLASPGKRAVKRVCVCVTHCSFLVHQTSLHSRRNHYRSIVLLIYSGLSCHTWTGLLGMLQCSNKGTITKHRSHTCYTTIRTNASSLTNVVCTY